MFCFISFDVFSLRALYGIDLMSNAVHGASDLEAAGAELKTIFGDVEFDEEGMFCGGFFSYWQLTFTQNIY